MEVRTEIDLFNDWFRIADQDRDGRIGGQEAVDFLSRSGLSKDTLYRVRPWCPRPFRKQCLVFFPQRSLCFKVHS
jgi:hypothetical protein